MKYIDAERLRKAVEKKYNSNDTVSDSWDLGYDTACKQILQIIDSIQQEQFPLLDNLNEAAEEQTRTFGYQKEDYEYKELIETFKAGAEWYASQMKMPNSSELISAWRGVKSILQEKDFRGDEWRLAYNAFMIGFSKGLNTRTEKK